MKFLVGKDLDHKIRGITEQTDARCAVAFFGQGAATMFGEKKPKGVRVICNLRSGGTNPHEIEEIRKFAKVKQCDTLHAKVYISKEKVVVCSANASANGLGLEGDEQARWIEAGVEIDDVEMALKWFEELWKTSSEILEEDIKVALKKWGQRRSSKPTLLSFRDFIVTDKDFPFVAWFGGTEKYTNKKKNIERQKGKYDQKLATAIDNGLEVSHPKERGILSGKWVLCFPIKEDWTVHRGQNPYWVKCDDLLEGAYQYEKQGRGYGKSYDCYLGWPSAGPVPFKLKDEVFQRAFRAVMDREKFKELRGDEQAGPWFNESRVRLTQEFWADLKEEYLKLDQKNIW